MEILRIVTGAEAPRQGGNQLDLIVHILYHRQWLLPHEIIGLFGGAQSSASRLGERFSLQDFGNIPILCQGRPKV